MKKRRRFFLILIGVGVLVSVIALAFRPAPEPEYGGKRLSEWVIQNCIGGLGADVRQAQAREAIRHIGTNAIPYLLAWGKYRMPAWRVRLTDATDKLPENLKFNWMLANRKFTLWGCSSDAFAILGSEARAAIPELTRMMNDPKVDNYTGWAISSLSYLGAEALPSLLTALTNRDNAIRRDAVTSMGNLGTNALSALPRIIELLQDKDIYVRKRATNALRQIDPQALEKATAR